MIDINATLVAQMLNFLILVVVLRLVAYKPIVKMLKEREERIAGSIEKADADMAEAEAVLKDYKALLASARVKALLVAIQRGEDEYIKPDGNETFMPHDTLWVVGNETKLAALCK